MMYPQKAVRKISLADVPNLVSFWQRAFPNDPPHNAPDLVLQEKLKIDDLVFVCEVKSNNTEPTEIVGACMAGYDGHRGWLYAVAVEPKHRREGIGQLLVDHAIAKLKILGCKKVNLQIRMDNTGVVGFYESLGFAVENRLSMGKRL